MGYLSAPLLRKSRMQMLLEKLIDECLSLASPELAILSQICPRLVRIFFSQIQRFDFPNASLSPGVPLQASAHSNMQL